MSHRIPGDRLAGTIAGEEPRLWPAHLPIVAQDLQELGRQHHVAVFLAFALLDADDHSLAVDVGGLQLNRLRDAQAGGIARGQDGVVFDVGDAAEEPLNFLGTEDDRQLLRLLGKRQDLFRRPVPFERHTVEKAQRRNGGVDRAGRQLLLVGQINLVGPNVLAPEQVRRLAEVTREQRDLLKVGELGIEREVAHLHVLAHALAKLGHDKLLCPME